MKVDFDGLLDDDDSIVKDPRDIFLTLDRDKGNRISARYSNRGHEGLVWPKRLAGHDHQVECRKRQNAGRIIAAAKLAE